MVDYARIHEKFAHTGIWEYAWDDLRFPAQAINPAGQTSPADIEADTGLLLFAPNATEVIGGVAQMPHAWLEGSAVVPHVHWQKTTSAAGGVYWQFEYEIVNNGDVATMAYGNVIGSSTAVDGTVDDDTANRVLITSFGEIDMTDCRISCLLFWKIKRVHNNAGDTYGADARLIEFDIHYQTDAPGSDQEFIKNYTKVNAPWL